MDRLDEPRVEVVAGDRAELLGRFAPVERHEREPLDATGPFELGQERQQRVAAMELVGAVREQEHHRDVAQVPDEEPEQVAGRAIGPVQVLDDEHDRRPSGQALEDPEEQLEQAALARAVAQGTGRAPAGSGDGPEVGDQPGQLGATLAQNDVELLRVGPADEPAQGFGDRGVRHRTLAQVDAPAEQDDGALRLGDRGDLRDDPRLADAGLAGQERRAAATLVGRLQGRAQSADLAGSADRARGWRRGPPCGSIITPVMAVPHPANVVTLGPSGRSRRPGHVREPAHDRERPAGAPAPSGSGLGIGGRGRAQEPAMLGLVKDLLSARFREHLRAVAVHLAPALSSFDRPSICVPVSG